MANPNRENLSKKAKDRTKQNGINTAGQLDYSEVIKTTLEQFSITQAMQMAAFFTGKGNDAKTLNSAQQKANQSTQPSILGKSNSVLSTLQSIQKSISNSLSINGQGLGGNIKSIKENCAAIKEALYNNNESLAQLIYRTLSEYSDAKLNGLLEKISIYEKSSDKQFQTIQSILDYKETVEKISEAKLKLIIEGLDDSTINSLIKFSELNLDQLDKNAQNLTIFFKALESISKLKLEPDKLVKSMLSFNIVLGSLIMSIPLLMTVNSIFVKHTIRGKNIRLVSLNSTAEIFEELGLLFGKINQIDTVESAKGNKILASLGYIFGINTLLLSNLSLMALINKTIKSDSLKKLYYLYHGKRNEKGFKEIFIEINDMTPISNGLQILKSFFLFRRINSQLISSIKSVDELSEKDYNNKKLFLASISLKNMSIIFDIINKMKGLDKDAKKKIDDITRLFGDPDKIKKGQDNKYINTSLKQIFENINKTEIPETTSLNGISNSINDIKTIIDNLNSINDLSKDPDKILENLDKYFKVLEESYKKIQEKFDQIIATGNTAEKVKEANVKIKEALESTNETVVKTSTKEKEIKKSVVAIEGITEFMVSATFVMAIGALFIELGGGKFVKDALEFGIVLSIFEGLVLLPAITFVTQEKTATKGIDGLHKLLITSTIILGIGALFMYLSNGEFVKNALKFGLVLSVFELLIISPFMMFAAVKSNVLSSAKDLNTVIITSTIIMAIGALFMNIGKGAFVKNALAFAIVLSTFEMLIILPFMLFGAISDDVFKNAKEFTAFVIVSTIILSIGALFVQISKGAFVKDALAFAVILGVFEALVILPFLLFNLVKKEVFDGISAFTGCVMVSTLALLIGAYVMQSKETVIGALLFTGLLMLFETGVILPFLIFNLIEDKVFDGLKGFALVVLVSTAALIMGAYFVSAQNGKFVKDAFIFIGILAAFMAGITLPFLLFKQQAKEFIKGAQEFGMFVAICSFSLILGAYVLEFIGKGDILHGALTIGAYAVILGLFVWGMIGIAKIIKEIKKEDIEAAVQFSLFVLICSSSLILGATLFAMGPEYIIGGFLYAVVLGLFVLAMGAVMVYINKAFKAAGGDAKVMANAITLGGFILLCSVSLAIAAFVYHEFKEDAIYGAILLAGFIVVVGTIFAGLTALSVVIGPGAVIATLMGVSLLTLSTSLLIINSLMGDGKDEVLKKNISALNIVIEMLADTYNEHLGGMAAIWITMGSVAATALGASLMLLGGSLALVNFLMGEGKDQQLITNIATLDTIIDKNLRETYERLGESVIWITLGSVAAVALSGSLVLLTGALRLIPFFIEPIKDKLNDNITTINTALTNYKNVIETLLDMGGDIALGLVTVIPLGLLVFGLSKAIVAMSNSVKKMAAVGDLSSQTSIISSNINNYIGIIDNIDLGNIIDIGLRMGKIVALAAMVMPMNLAIRGIASSVQSIASLRIPEEWDENGKPIKFRQISNKDFDLVTININRLLRTTADAFAYAWNHGLKTIAADKNGGFWKTLWFANSASTILANMTDSVIKIGQALVPDPTSWDAEKGKFTKYEKVDFAKASINAGFVVYSILTMLSNAFISAYNGGSSRPGLKTLFYKDSPFTKAVDAITKMTQTLSGITDSVIKIASAQIPNKWDKDGKVISYEKINVEEAIKNFRKVLIGNGKTPGIINSMLGAFKMAAARILDNEILSDDEKMKLITGRITSMVDIIGKVAGIVVKISSLTIPTEFNKDGKGTNFVKLSITDIDNAKTNITTILKAILSTFDPKDPNNEIASYLCSEVINTQYINKNLDNVGIIIKSLTTQITNITTLQDELNKTFNKKKGDVIDVSNVVVPFDDIMNKLFNHLNSLKRIYTEDFSEVNFDNNNVFKKISEDVQNYMNNVVDPFDPIRLMKATSLIMSINGIYKSLTKQKNMSGNMNANTNALQKYIKAINTVDTSKLKPLTTLVVELNKLANKLGSLDKVANTLSNELAVVLKELVDSLNEAKGTINTAHELQNDRHKKIEEAITKVRRLMDSPLNITVKPESSAPEQQFETPGDDSDKKDNKSSVSSSGGDSGVSGGKKQQNENTPPTRDGQKPPANIARPAKQTFGFTPTYH